MSDIWLRKIKTYFHVVDFQKKGVITLEEWKLMPKWFAEKENASSDLRDKATKSFHDVSYFKLEKYRVTSETCLISIKLAKSNWSVRMRFCLCQTPCL